MLNYIIQVTACSGILYGYYHFFLRNEKFHHYNRFYLLLSVAASLLLPLLELPVLVSRNAGKNIPGIFMSTGENVTVTTLNTGTGISFILYSVALCITLFFILKLIAAIYRIMQIRLSSAEEKHPAFRLIKTSHADAPFSFFRWLFWNNRFSIDSAAGRHIFRHEMYHINNRHSLDLLFMEIILCICWFNPFFYLYRKEISTIQEFLADKYASDGENRYEYASCW